MTEPQPPRRPTSFNDRLRAIRERRGRKRGGTDSVGGLPTTAVGMAFRIGVEMVSALIVGVGIGLLLDWWLGTKPWLMVVFFFLGAGAGILNVYRAVAGLGAAPGYRRPDETGGEAETRDSE